MIAANDNKSTDLDVQHRAGVEPSGHPVSMALCLMRIRFILVPQSAKTLVSPDRD
jgi:hypothetical protein